MTTQLPPYDQPPAPVPPRKRRHWIRNTFIAIGTLIVLIVVISVTAGGKGSTPNPAPSPAVTHQAAAKTPAAPTLTAGEQSFVATVKATLAEDNETVTATDAQIAGIGTHVCQVREDGGSQAAIIGVVATHGSGVTSPHLTAGKIVRTAERDICPAQYPQPPVVLLRMTGNGIQNSAPFLVTSGTLTVTYTYDCSAMGMSGNFIADIETGDQGSLSSDDQSVANALGTGGTATTTVYPQNVGSDYHLAVNSECSWTVTVEQG